MQNKYRLEHSGACWQICERREAGKDAKNPGEITHTPFKYFGTLEQAALRLREILLTDKLKEDTELADLIKALADSQAEVLTAVKAAGEAGAPNALPKPKTIQAPRRAAVKVAA